MDDLSGAAHEAHATDSGDHCPLRGTSATLRFAAIPRRGFWIPLRSNGFEN